MKKWCIIASLLILLLATGCGSSGPAPAGKLDIVSHRITWGESGAAEVSVTVKNVGYTSIDFAEVTVKFYAAKTPVGTSTDGVMNLGPGEIWDFNIPCSGAGCDQVTNYEVTATASSSQGY
jgi:hypothetical protein